MSTGYYRQIMNHESKTSDVPYGWLTWHKRKKSASYLSKQIKHASFAPAFLIYMKNSHCPLISPYIRKFKEKKRKIKEIP